jgi:hypothetical protein
MEKLTDRFFLNLSQEKIDKEGDEADLLYLLS